MSRLILNNGLPLNICRSEPVLSESSPRPEGKEIEPSGDGKGFYKVSVSYLIENEMQAHAAQDTKQDRIRVFIDQKTVEEKQLIGMEH